ncbi:lariat debranching enzyme [Bonamia ostreae]|uniref:Lariat debranching enzyme n=1 Tax=Bonamia ostreae TaxID=126728 RepID=A0ABV2ARR2_9EUKA
MFTEKLNFIIFSHSQKDQILKLKVKFSAIFKHENNKTTKFLALGKCLKNIDFVQLLKFPNLNFEKSTLSYDAEWLSIVRKTNKLIPLSDRPLSMEIYEKFIKKEFEITNEEMSKIEMELKNFEIPKNFEKTAPGYNSKEEKNYKIEYRTNPQTTKFCEKLKIEDMFYKKQCQILSKNKETIAKNDKNEIEIDKIFE